MIMSKPKRVRARITRTVTEFATVNLDKHGGIDEILEVHEEVETDNVELVYISYVTSLHD